jgi:proteasome lid subunit RPN8/RPN11
MIKFLKKPNPPAESSPRAAAPPLRILQQVLTMTCGHARDASPNECMGLLASRRGDRSGVVTHAFLLNAEACLARAVADPQGIAEVVARLRECAMNCRGFWHSHVGFSAHHSRVDDTTMERLLPGMAEENYIRPAFRHTAPAVTSSDEAMLPLADGTALAFTLVGPPIPGLDAHEKAGWSSVTTRFHDRSVVPRTILKNGLLHLCSGQVVLALGVPAGATLSSRVVEISPVRVATMYSLVVNVREETYAESLTVHDIDGRSFIEMGPCAIEVVDRPEANGPTIGIGQSHTIKPMVRC